MTVLHASTDPDLLTRLRQMLSSAARADIAVGYFFMSGFGQLADDLSQLRKCRILIGRTDAPTLEAVAAGLRDADALRAQLDSEQTVRRSQRLAVANESASNIARSVAAMPQTDASQDAVDKLQKLVASGLLEMRAYPRGVLHAKAYLCWYDGHAEPGAAIVGSSNFTLAGFTGNTELNVRVTGDDEMAVLKDWFENLWADSVDISSQVEQHLTESWAVKQYTPYAVYLKALYELYGKDLGSDEPLPLEPVRQVELANFQLDAVRRGLDMIRSYGGCYVADVVGLGKTYVGAELLRQLRHSYPNDGPPLIICPAGLVRAWQQVSEQYGLGAEVLSQSRIAPPPDLVFDPETEQYEEATGNTHGVYLPEEYRYRGPVLVDEAHNFRNDVNRSRGLRDYLEQGDHKVILLSATPQNLGPRDIYRQVRLFLDETDHGLPLEPQGLEDYFASVIKWQEYRQEVDAYSAALATHLNSSRGGAPPTRPQRPDTPPADIAQVLTPIFIRRRRKDIARHIRRHGNHQRRIRGVPDSEAFQSGVPTGQGIRQGRRLHRPTGDFGPTPGGALQPDGVPETGTAKQSAVRRFVPSPRSHCGDDPASALQAAGVQHPGISLNTRVGVPQQPQLQGGTGCRLCAGRQRGNQPIGRAELQRRRSSGHPATGRGQAWREISIPCRRLRCPTLV